MTSSTLLHLFGPLLLLVALSWLQLVTANSTQSSNTWNHATSHLGGNQTKTTTAKASYVGLILAVTMFMIIGILILGIVFIVWKDQMQKDLHGQSKHDDGRDHNERDRTAKKSKNSANTPKPPVSSKKDHGKQAGTSSSVKSGSGAKSSTAKSSVGTSTADKSKHTGKVSSKAK